jgi:predicted Zn-ribbon and HTH transcriptional regulator
MLLEKRAMNYSSSYNAGYNNNTDNNIASRAMSYNPNTAHINNVKDTASHQNKLFLLCEACFWCATYLLNDDSKTVSKCPACDNAKVESLPIANNEVYKFDYNSSGSTFEFGTRNMNIAKNVV